MMIASDQRLRNEGDHLRLALHGLGGINDRILGLLVLRVVAWLIAVVHHNGLHGLGPVLSRTR